MMLAPLILNYWLWPYYFGFGLFNGDANRFGLFRIYLFCWMLWSNWDNWTWSYAPLILLLPLRRIDECSLNNLEILFVAFFFDVWDTRAGIYGDGFGYLEVFDCYCSSDIYGAAVICYFLLWFLFSCCLFEERVESSPMSLLLMLF